MSASLSITSVSNDAPGTFGIGQTLHLTLTANASLVLDTGDGSPKLTLSNGGTAFFDAGATADAGANQLVFSYVVAEGESAADLAVSSLDLNGAIITSQPVPAGLNEATTLYSGGQVRSVAIGDLDGDTCPTWLYPAETARKFSYFSARPQTL